MGWAFLLLFAGLAAGLVWRYARLPRAGVELTAAAALVGVAGYAWQGSPGEAGAPVKARASELAPPDLAATAMRRAMSGRFGDDTQVVEFADTLDRLGLTREAVIAVKTGIAKHPNSVDLWTALGTTLVAHGEGHLTPAAEFAFRRAAQLNPAHPGPPFFLGLALAQSGRSADAAQVWSGLLARTSPDAPWRKGLEERLAGLRDAPS